MWLDPVIQFLEKMTNITNRASRVLAIVMLLSMMVLTFGDVIGRNIFASPIYGTYELTGIALALLVFFTLGYVQHRKEHISVGVLVDKWSVKAQAAIDLLVYCLFFIVLWLTTWQLAEHGRRLFKTGNVTSDLQLPLYIFAFLTSIGILLFSLTFLLDIFKSLRKLVSKHEH